MKEKGEGDTWDFKFVGMDAFSQSCLNFLRNVKEMACFGLSSLEIR